MTNDIINTILISAILITMLFFIYNFIKIMVNGIPSNEQLKELSKSLNQIITNQEKIIMLYKLRLLYIGKLNSKLYDCEGETDPPPEDDPDKQPGSSGG